MIQFSFADIDSNFPRLEIRQMGVLKDNATLFVQRLSYGATHNVERLDNPTWEQIVSAITKLDGRQDVLLEGKEALPYLVVGGGKHGKYLVVAAQKNAVLYLSDPRSQEQKECTVVIGGQPSEYAADLAVTHEMAMQAIWAFVEQGILLPSLHWVEDI